MEITFLAESRLIPNKSPDVDQLFRTMNTLLDEQQLHISHMIVDGQPIYEDYKSYIQDRISIIQQVQVNTVTIKEYIGQLVLSSHEYCVRAIQQAPELTAQFYQQPSQDTWQLFEQLLEGMDWLTQFIQLVQETNVSYSNVQEYAEIGQTIHKLLPELLEDVKLERHTSIGDALLYEIIPQLEALREELQKTMDSEVIQYDPK